jgi:hypothetical protein
VLAEECEISLDEMAKSEPRTEANSAPPAALLAAGLHDNDDDDERLWLKLQCEMVTRESCADSVNWAGKRWGYAYDLNDMKIAPPRENASSAKPEEKELQLQ